MDSIFEKIQNEIGEYYRSKSLDAAASTKVGWKNEQAQRVRFDQIAKVISQTHYEGFTINDLGCGLGDLSAYLSGLGFEDFLYNGYDISEEMIRGALALHGKRKNIVFTKISQTSEMKMADYTVASGVFNLKFGLPEYEWLYYILSSLKAMDDNSRLGFSFNMLSIYSDTEYRRAELYYGDPGFFFDYCKRNFSRNVALLHDYGEYDFTIVVRKG